MHGFSYLFGLALLFALGEMSPDNFDLHAAREIPDSDHYGMDDVNHFAISAMILNN